MSLTNTRAPAHEAVRDAIRKAYDDGYNDAKMAPDNCSTYCGQRAEREGTAALLSKLRAPVAEVMDALNWVDDFIARCNRDDRGSCESVNVLRRALASAPVAGEAVAWKCYDAGLGKHMLTENPKVAAMLRAEGGNKVRPLVYADAAPQASEAVRDAGIAASEDVAPWTDFAGNPIKHGDRIRHPEGLEGVVVRLPGCTDAHDAWCVAYQDRTVSRLSLQIGERGQAVVQAALSAQPGAQKGGCDAE